MARIAVMMAVWLVLAGSTFGQTGVQSLPDLQGDQLETIRTEPGEPQEYQSRAFGPLLTNARLWGLTMKKWSADSSLADGWMTMERLIAFTEDPQTHAGKPVSVFGRFRERQTLGGQYQGVERWLLEFADREDASAPMGPVVVLFVVRDASVVLNEPQEGWYVSAAARYYKPMELPSRTSGEQRIYPAFVGAVFDVSRSRAGPLSEVFVWVALAVAILMAIGVTVAFILIKKRGNVTPLPRTPTPSAGDIAPMGASDPEEALRQLHEEARPRADADGEEEERG